MAIELENSTPPEWMIALENKKRHHKLAHEIGAGAPCLNCSDRCSGLDLHFWRKICRNCKCKKEVHDVKEENNFEQFEILFGVGDEVKCNNRVKKISLDLKGKLDDIFSAKETSTSDSNSSNDLSFDWIPTDVPANLATEYLQQLPLDKLPITGSAGAMFRRQQLQKQMPLHDFKANNCHELTDEESQAFSQYVDNLRTNAVGMGQITKIPTSVVETNDDTHSSKPPLAINNLNSIPKPFKPFSKAKEISDEDDIQLPPTDSTFVSTDLKTPSAFVPYKKFNSQFTRQNVNEPQGDVSWSGDNETPSVDELTERCSQQLTMNNESDTKNNNITQPSEGSLTPRDIIRKLNAQQADVKKELIKSPDVFCERSRPYSSKYEPLSSSNGHPSHQESNAVKNVDVKLSKVGHPEQFMAVSSYVPKKPQLSNRLTSTLDRNHNIDVVRSNSPSNNALVKRPSTVCHECKIAVHPGQIVVVAERAGIEAVWHPQCFVCVACKELLVDLVYFFHRGEVYCGRHYAENLQIPRCFACDELIFVKEYTVAENQTFHVKHFCCFECDIPLADKQYVPKDNNPVCLPCYQAKYGKSCHYCGKSIKAGDQRIGWDNFSWHALASCFKCVQCSKSLLNGKFVMRNENPMCSKECVVEYEARFR